MAKPVVNKMSSMSVARVVVQSCSTLPSGLIGSRGTVVGSTCCFCLGFLTDPPTLVNYLYLVNQNATANHAILDPFLFTTLFGKLPLPATLLGHSFLRYSVAWERAKSTLSKSVDSPFGPCWCRTCVCSFRSATQRHRTEATITTSNPLRCFSGIPPHRSTCCFHRLALAYFSLQS